MLVFLGLGAYAQRLEPEARQGFLFQPHWAYQYAGGDLAERYYPFSSIGMAVEYKTRSGWQFGFDYDWYYGEKVRDTGLFEGIIASSRQVIDQDGHFSIIDMDIQGHYVSMQVGRLFSLTAKRPNSGIYLALGAGYLRHKIDIRASQVTIPQINGEYEKGYDRLAGGPALREFIGYQFLEQHNRFHFRVGLEFNQGFTKGMRSWNYSTNSPGTEDRLDLPVALKFSLIVPVYTKESEDEEFFID